MIKKTAIQILVVLAVFTFAGCDSVGKIDAEKIQKETARVSPQVQGIAEAVTDQELTGNDVQDFIAMLQAGNAASAPFNPYALPIGSGLAALSALLGFLAKKKNDEADQYKRKYNAHKQGVEATIKQLGSSQNGAVFDQTVYDNIGKARERNGV